MLDGDWKFSVAKRGGVLTPIVGWWLKNSNCHSTHWHHRMATKLFWSPSDTFTPLDGDQKISIALKGLTHPHVWWRPICFWSPRKGGMSYVLGKFLPPFCYDWNFLVAIGKENWIFFDCHSVGDQNILVVARVVIKKNLITIPCGNEKQIGRYKVQGLFFNRHKVYDNQNKSNFNCL